MIFNLIIFSFSAMVSKFHYKFDGFGNAFNIMARDIYFYNKNIPFVLRGSKFEWRKFWQSYSDFCSKTVSHSLALEDTQLINRNFKTIVFNFEQIFKSILKMMYFSTASHTSVSQKWREFLIFLSPNLSGST